MFGVWLLVAAVLAAADVQGAPGSRDRRSGDDPALLAVVGELSQQLVQYGAHMTALQNTVAQLQQQLQQQHDKASLHVAVHARLSDANFAHANKNQVIKFDMVLTNQGAAYDPATGVFTAPVSGLYVFLFSTHAVDAAHRGDVYLHADGHGQVFVNDREYMATGHAAFHLNGGDKAWVASNGDDRFVYSFDTMFTAFLVNPDW